MLHVPQCLGPFVVVQLNSIVTSANGNSVTLSSTATVNVSSLNNVTTNVTITCDGNGDGVGGRDALLIIANGMFTPDRMCTYTMLVRWVRPYSSV